MSITPLPPAPNRTEPSTFSDKADAFVAALPQFATEANALGAAANASANAAQAARVAAESARDETQEFRGESQVFSLIAQASANFRGTWSVSTSYALGDCVTIGDEFYVALRSNTGQNPTTSPLDWVNLLLLQLDDLDAATLPLASADQTLISQGGVSRRAPIDALVRTANTRPAGSWFSAQVLDGTSAAAPNVANGRMVLIPFTPERPMTIQRFQIQTGDDPGGTLAQIALAIYNSAENGLPTGAPIFGGTAFTPTYPNVQVGYNTTVALPARRLWLAFVKGPNNASVRRVNNTLTQPFMQELLTVVGSDDSSIVAAISNTAIVPFRDGVTVGTWPTLTGQFSDFTGRTPANATGAQGIVPAFSFRVA